MPKQTKCRGLERAQECYFKESLLYGTMRPREKKNPNPSMTWQMVKTSFRWLTLCEPKKQFWLFPKLIKILMSSQCKNTQKQTKSHWTEAALVFWKQIRAFFFTHAIIGMSLAVQLARVLSLLGELRSHKEKNKIYNSICSCLVLLSYSTNEVSYPLKLEETLPCLIEFLLRSLKTTQPDTKT